MRIAHVAPPAGRSASGILTVLAELTAALARRGHDVAVWHDGDWEAPGLRRTAAALDDAGVRRLRLDASPRRAPALPAVSLPAGAAADLVHLHSVFVPLNAAIARTWTGPLLLSPHGGYDPVSLRRSRLRKQVYSALHERRLVRRADTVVALTEVEAGHVRRFAGQVSTAVVPNGVRPLPPGRAGTDIREQFGVPRDARLAVFVGRLDVPHKGLDRLVRATAAAPSWHVLLVGPDHRGGLARLRQLAAGLGAADRVRFAGQLEPVALAGVHAAADLFVLPSRWEGLPMSLLEALACGVPALVTPEVDRLVPVSSRAAGWVSAPDALGAALEAVATLPADALAWHAAAARDLAGNYDWDAVAAACERVYDATLQRWPPAGTAVQGTVPR
jgi:glycosyltransferase involved in cell wall biosynthesis